MIKTNIVGTTKVKEPTQLEPMWTYEMQIKNEINYVY